jgi:diadenosine tetraphosphate (Ap4A) HIT family hydrolase
MTESSPCKKDDRPWSLHPQLLADTSAVGDLPLSQLRAINDADYPWLILVPRRSGITEIEQLAEEAGLLMSEIIRVSRVLKDLTACDKLNIAAIGNVVRQLHVHIVGRRHNDPLWPKPIWGFAAPRAGDPAEFLRFVVNVRQELGIATP